MQENIAIFAILVLIAHVAGVADSQTALGAKIFLGARVVHGVVYMAGVPGLRTTTWAVSVGGMAMIALRIAG